MLEEFYTFPANRVEALTILYLERQELSGKTPEELADLYLEAHGRISRQFVARANGSRKPAAVDETPEAATAAGGEKKTARRHWFHWFRR